MTETTGEPLDKADVFKFISNVHNRLKESIGADFTLARYDNEDKKFIIEMVGNAYFAQRTLKKLIEKAKTEAEKRGVRLIANRVFDDLLVRTYMVTITSRNVDQNVLLNIIGETRTELETEKEGKKQELKETLKEMVREEKGIWN